MALAMTRHGADILENHRKTGKALTSATGLIAVRYDPLGGFFFKGSINRDMSFVRPAISPHWPIRCRGFRLMRIGWVGLGVRKTYETGMIRFEYRNDRWQDSCVQRIAVQEHDFRNFVPHDLRVQRTIILEPRSGCSRDRLGRPGWRRHGDDGTGRIRKHR